jgi:lipopolysaccharide transport system ATP-binding protein
MPDSPVLVEVRGLGKRFARQRTFNLFEMLAHRRRGAALDDRFWALDDVSFDVRAGEVMGVIGSNGAGKSTLLKILSRVLMPTRGEALLRGQVASLLEVGTGFHGEMTGRENIYFNATLLGMKRHEIDRLLDSIVDFSGVEAFLDMPLKRYSTGMYVRLAFAVAAHVSADIMFIDEVLAVGDASFQRQCLRKIDEVATHGRVVVLVSHNAEMVRRLCNRVIWLDRGRLVEDSDDVGGVMTRYLGAGEEP